MNNAQGKTRDPTPWSAQYFRIRFLSISYSSKDLNPPSRMRISTSEYAFSRISAARARALSELSTMACT